MIAHLRQGSKITAADIGLPKWAQKLKKPAVRKLAHGRHALFEGEKQVVAVDEVEDAHAQLRE